MKSRIEEKVETWRAKHHMTFDSKHIKVQGQVITPDSAGKTVGKRASQYFHLEWLDGW